MYEVELKVELTAQERDALIKSFKDRDFPSKGVTPQNDNYIEAKKSPHGGLDFKRYRNEGGKFIYTEKIWETHDGERVRRENEREVPKEEFESILAQFPKALKIQKDREWFKGNLQGNDISITIDSVKFDHSPRMRYFIEAEIDVKEKEEVAKTKATIKEFLKDLLGKPEIKEAPGMFTMALDKL